MASATLATVEALLKEVYGPRLVDQLQNEIVTTKRLERTSDGVTTTVGGKYVDFPVRVRRNHGIGYRVEDEQLPAAGRQGYAEVHVPLKFGYGRGKLTGQLMELAEKDYQSFASSMDNEMEYLKSDLLKDEEFIAYASGNGLRATVVTDGANNVVVDNIQYIEVGMIIDILVISTGAILASNRTVTAVTPAATGFGGTVAYDGADVTANTTHGIFRQGDFVGGTAREPSGFGIIVDDTTTFHSLNPATEPEWAAQVFDNPAGAGTPRALSEGLMINTCDAVRRKGGKTSAIFTSLGVRRSYFNLLTQQRRYTDTKEFAGGFQGLPFNYGTEIPVVEVVDAPPQTMWFIDEKEIKIYQSGEWSPIKADGTVLKWVHDFDAFEFVYKKYYEYGTNKRNAHARLNDVQEG